MLENLNAYPKYTVPVPLPQPDIQPNSIKKSNHKPINS